MISWGGQEQLSQLRRGRGGEGQLSYTTPSSVWDYLLCSGRMGWPHVMHPHHCTLAYWTIAHCPV